MIRPTLLALSLVLFSGCGGSSSNGGNEGPGGGDVRALEASALLPEIAGAVRASPERFPEFSLAELDQAIGRAKVIMRPRTYANGVETDATNNGHDLIELNAARWPGIERNQRIVLLFHEVLGLMRLEKNSYAISNRLLRAESRFASEVTYQCESCQIRLIYDFTQKALIMNNGYCSFFDPGTKIFRGSGISFSWDTHPGEPNNHFRQLSLMDGDTICFSGDLYPRWPKRLFCKRKG